MNTIIFWAAVGSSATIGIAIGTIFGVLVALKQLSQINRSTGNEAILKLYELFDEENKRQNRRKIWQELQLKKPEILTIEEWATIERTATDMDVVGTMLKHKQIEKSLVF